MATRGVFAVDIGNTNVTAALAVDGELGRVVRAMTDPDVSREAFGATLRALLAETGSTPEELAGVVVASVVPPLTAHVRAIADEMGLALLVADETTVPIPIRVDHPAEVGADRLIDAYAAGYRYGMPIVVVDFGTATTVEAVGSDGAYLGGAIAPGLRLGIDALAERTALLPRVEPELPPGPIGTNTVDAIQAGAVLGHRELAAGLVRLVRNELAEREGVPASSIRAVATGGISAAAWVRSIDGIDVVDPLLTLHGLVGLWTAVGPGAAASRR